jgi:hypothetical protein
VPDVYASDWQITLDGSVQLKTSSAAQRMDHRSSSTKAIVVIARCIHFWMASTFAWLSSFQDWLDVAVTDVAATKFPFADDTSLR